MIVFEKKNPRPPMFSNHQRPRPWAACHPFPAWRALVTKWEGKRVPGKKPGSPNVGPEGRGQHHPQHEQRQGQANAPCDPYFRGFPLFSVACHGFAPPLGNARHSIAYSAAVGQGVGAGRDGVHQLFTVEGSFGNSFGLKPARMSCIMHRNNVGGAASWTRFAYRMSFKCAKPIRAAATNGP